MGEDSGHAAIYDKIEKLRDKSDQDDKALQGKIEKEAERVTAVEKTIIALGAKLDRYSDTVMEWMRIDRERDHHNTPCPSSVEIKKEITEITTKVERLEKERQEHQQSHEDEAKKALQETINERRDKDKDWRKIGFQVLGAVAVVVAIGFFCLVSWKLFKWDPRNPIDKTEQQTTK